MKRIGKIIGLLGLGVLILGAGALAALVWLLDPNDYKAELQALARDKAGVALKLDGDIAWRLLPQPALHLQRISVTGLNPPQTPLAELDSLSLTVSLRSLLSRQIQLSDFRVDGLKLAQSTLAVQGTLLYDQPTRTLTGNDLRLTIDDSRFSGNLTWVSPPSGTPALRLSLQGERLDIDRYLPAPDPVPEEHRANTDSTETDSASAAPASGPDKVIWRDRAILPLRHLRRMDVQLDLAVQQLALKQLLIENLRLQASNQNGVLTLQTLQGTLGEGNFVVQGDINITDAQSPLLKADIKLNELPLEKLLAQTAAAVADKLTGNLTAELALRTRGNSEKNWVNNLNGNIHWSIKNGVLGGVNVEHTMCQGIALLNRKRLGNAPFGDDTRFATVSGSFHIAGGVADNPDLFVQLAGLRALSANGEGKVDLRTLTLDYRLGVLIEADTRSLPDPACAINPRYVGLALPLRCQGTLQTAARTCRLDQAGINQIALRLINQMLNEKLDKTGIEPGDTRLDGRNVRNLLKGLIGR